MKRSVGAPKGNTNAAKEGRTDTQIGPFRCTTAEKVAMVKAANGKLAPWVLAHLNNAAQGIETLTLGDFRIVRNGDSCTIVRDDSIGAVESATIRASELEAKIDQLFPDVF